jgi:hypothetical protein
MSPSCAMRLVALADLACNRFLHLASIGITQVTNWQMAMSMTQFHDPRKPVKCGYAPALIPACLSSPAPP